MNQTDEQMSGPEKYFEKMGKLKHNCRGARAICDENGINNLPKIAKTDRLKVLWIHEKIQN